MPPLATNCVILRKPTQAAVNEAAAKKQPLPKAERVGTFTVPAGPVDARREAAKLEGARRVKLDPSRVTVSFVPTGETEAGGKQVHKIHVLVPAE